MPSPTSSTRLALGVGRVLALDEVEGLAVPPDGVLGRERRERVVAGRLDVPERLVEVGGAGGRDPVARQLGRADAPVDPSSSTCATRRWARWRRLAPRSW